MACNQRPKLPPHIQTQGFGGGRLYVKFRPHLAIVADMTARGALARNPRFAKPVHQTTPAALENDDMASACATPAQR